MLTQDCVESRLVDPRLVESRLVDPRLVDPRLGRHAIVYVNRIIN